MSLPTGKSEPLDLPHISSYQEVGEQYKKNPKHNTKSDLEMFCKEEDTDIYCPEHQSLPSGPISGHGSKGVACVCVCRRECRGGGISR